MKKTVLAVASMAAWYGTAGSALADNSATSSLTGAYNESITTQSGDGLASHIDQDGGLNYAAHRQTGTDNAADSTQFGTYNTSWINQSGSNNQAALVQEEGSFNASEIDQTGVDNIASVRQADFVFNTNNNASYVLQQGSANEANVNQDGHDSSEIYQYGSGNFALMDQIRVDFSFGAEDFNDATITQNGDNNKAWVTQGGTFNTAVITQSIDNTASVDQSGDWNESYVNQGDLNEAYVTQSGDWNESYVNQDGLNEVHVFQSGVGTVVDPNVVAINQFDGGDVADADQHGGEGNSITINQDEGPSNGAGANNFAGVLQVGAFNTAVVTQGP